VGENGTARPNQSQGIHQPQQDHGAGDLQLEGPHLLKLGPKGYLGQFHLQHKGIAGVFEESQAEEAQDG